MARLGAWTVLLDDGLFRLSDEACAIHAGAGVANFSHIVSLRPDFVKVDIGLVRGVDHDLTCQALIVGLRYFARATNGWLIGMADHVRTLPSLNQHGRAA